MELDEFYPAHLAKSVSKQTALPAVRDQDWLEAERERKDQAVRLGKVIFESMGSCLTNATKKVGAG
jgi:hypothetical protein